MSRFDLAHSRTDNDEVKVLRGYFTGENIRILGTARDPLFCGADVAKHIGDTGYRRTFSSYDKTYVRREKIFDPKGFLREYYFLTEIGLYKYLLQSHRPKAEEFQRFVFDQLRKLRSRVVEDTLIENAILKTETERAKAMASKASHETAMEREMCEMSMRAANDLREENSALKEKVSRLQYTRKPPVRGESSYAEIDAYYQRWEDDVY